MICGHDRRIPSMNIVIKRIDRILENRRGSNSTLTNAGKAALEQLKQSIAENKTTTAAHGLQQDQADAQLDVARRAIVSTVRTCLEDSAKELHTEGAIDSDVRTANCSTNPFDLGRARAQTLEGVELTWRKTTSPHERTFALQFQFFRKAGVRGKMKVGVLVAFEIREPNGKRVGDCAAYLAQKQMGKDRYQYSLTRGDPVPAFIEREVDAWGDMGELRHFVRHAISAFPNLIAGGTSQFVPRRR
jgi:hypothetical protein